MNYLKVTCAKAGNDVIDILTTEDWWKICHVARMDFTSGLFSSKTLVSIIYDNYILGAFIMYCNGKDTFSQAFPWKGLKRRKPTHYCWCGGLIKMIYSPYCAISTLQCLWASHEGMFSIQNNWIPGHTTLFFIINARYRVTSRRTVPRRYPKPTFQLIEHSWTAIMADSKTCNLLHVRYYRSVTDINKCKTKLKTNKQTQRLRSTDCKSSLIPMTYNHSLFTEQARITLIRQTVYCVLYIVMPKNVN